MRLVLLALIEINKSLTVMVRHLYSETHNEAFLPVLKSQKDVKTALLDILNNG